MLQQDIAPNIGLFQRQAEQRTDQARAGARDRRQQRQQEEAAVTALGARRVADRRLDGGGLWLAGLSLGLRADPRARGTAHRGIWDCLGHTRLDTTTTPSRTIDAEASGSTRAARLLVPPPAVPVICGLYQEDQTARKWPCLPTQTVTGFASSAKSQLDPREAICRGDPRRVLQSWRASRA